MLFFVTPRATASPCAQAPLVVTGIKWPTSQLGNRSLSWVSSTHPIVKVTYEWDAAGQRVTFVDNRGCTLTVTRK